ncbi:MAG: tyrosine recombinase XerC [Bacteroidetes bacterium]|nr:tyrosine recombinase XerC [Bacteroidota bacterium]
MINAERFLQHIRFEKRYSPHTVIAYQNDLKQFFFFLEERYKIQDIKAVDHFQIRSWLVELMNRKVSPRSVNRKLTSLKSFYKFLLKEGLVDSSPLGKVVAPKVAKKLPVFIEEDSLGTFLNRFSGSSDYLQLRDYLILELFYATGMRRAELLNLKEKDIDFTHSTLKVLGKRNKERLIPYGKHLAKILDDYLGVKQKYFELVTLQDDSLFLTQKGKKIDPRVLYRIVNSYLEEFARTEKKSPHVLRHTFATHMLNHGADLNAIKEILGHANLSATQIYTHNTIEKLKRIYEQAHPRA